MTKVVFFIFLSLFSMLVYSESWTGDLTVKQMFTEGTTDLVAVYTEGHTAEAYADGCTVGHWVFEANSEERRSRGYSTLMAALASGKKIKIWYSDTCGSWSWHKAKSIMLVK